MLDFWDNPVGVELHLSGDSRWFGVVKTLLLPGNEGFCGNSVKKYHDFIPSAPQETITAAILLCAGMDSQLKDAFQPLFYTLRCSK